MYSFRRARERRWLSRMRREEEEEEEDAAGEEKEDVWGVGVCSGVSYI
jgi:hypothetical protein